MTSFFGGLLSSLLGWGLNQYSGLSRSEREQNSFNASQAQVGRDFSAQQAEIERDWQEQMYGKYNSLQGKIDQARQAGVNPMFAVTGSAVSPMSPSAGVASSPTASGSASRGPNMDMVGAVLGFSKLKAEIDNINASTRQANSIALNNEIDSLTRGELNSANLASVMQAIENSKADTALKVAKTGEVAANVLNLDADTKVKTEQLGVMSAQIANIKADTDVKVMQLQSIASQIANTNADTEFKAGQILYVAAQTRNERLMASMITENTKLTRQQRIEVEKTIREMNQRYDHNQIMNAISEGAAALSLQEQGFRTPKNELDAMCKVVWESIVSVLSLGGYVHSTYNENRTTVIDGNPAPVRKRVGY